MTHLVIIALCIIILLSYLFDISSKYTKIPGVLLLILLGLALQLLATNTGMKIPNLQPILPLLGTVGLILIVMEASLDLKLNKSKKKIINQAASSAIVLLVLFTGVLAYLLRQFIQISWQTALLNAIPLAIISSAVAIPAAANLKNDDKEFVVYESSLSDILGILIFDFILIDHASISTGLLNLAFDGLITFLISVVTTIALAILLHKTAHHVNYVIIMTFIILIYTLAKMAHLPALLLILIFGMVLSNHQFFNLPFTIKFINFEKFEKDIASFKHIAGELTFLVRSFFFIMFGFYTKIDELLNLNNFIISVAIVLFILFIRWLFFKQVLRKEISPLLFFAPRGLITILLFLSIPEIHKIGLINEGLITQVIFISILLLTPGNWFKKKIDANVTGTV
ncbi:MAG: cation:proton antiporter [Bacteroidales bacterium]